MVTSGCSAALTHATAACVTGGNPDLHVRLPDLRGFAKDECIIPKHSRNVYDAAVRAVGVRVVEVATAEELEAAFGPRTRARLHPRGSERRRGAAQHEGALRGREEAGRAGAGGRGGRGPERAERAPAARGRPRRLQRRQVPARPAGRGAAARPQGPGEGRLGRQRAAPRLRPRLQGRQGRSDRHADGGRDVVQARPRRRVEAVAGVDRPHRPSRIGDRRRDHVRHAAGGALEPHADAADPLGPRAPRHERRGRRPPALRDGAAGVAVPGARQAGARTRPGSRSVPT